MKKTILICDYCKKTDNVQELTIFVERVPDGAGSMENRYHLIDLCPVCLKESILHLDKTNKLDGVEFVRRWTKY